MVDNVHYYAIIMSIISKEDIAMPQIIPITELRNTSDISDRCHSSMEPIFVTKNGFGDMVIMSMEAYDSMVNSSYIDDSIEEAERGINEGRPNISAKEAFRRLDSKYGIR